MPDTTSDTTESRYDSRPDTYQHIHKVQGLLSMAASLLLDRADLHDLSKLASPELEIFDKMTPLLKGSTYGSPEYQGFLAAMKPALDHHYANNRHHPEHFGEDGIRGMNLIDIVEMFCDWTAASQRHADGNIEESLKTNQKRFGFSDELMQIFRNTVSVLGSTAG